MHSLVVEAVIAHTEERLVHGAVFERGIVFAGDEPHVLDLEIGDDGLELRHAALALLVVGGGMGEVAGEHNEVRLLREPVHRGDRALQGGLRLGVGRPLESPVGVGHLDEEEVLPCGQGTAPATEAGGEDDAAEAGQPEEVLAIDRGSHLIASMRGATDRRRYEAILSTSASYSRKKRHRLGTGPTATIKPYSLPLDSARPRAWRGQEPNVICTTTHTCHRPATTRT